MASTYLSRSISSATNRKTWTYSTWFKKTRLGTSGNLSTRNIFLAAADGGFPEGIEINAEDQFEYDHDIAGTDYTLTSDMLFRDVNAWYHIVVTKDTTQATETDRLKVWVNGTQISLNEVSLGYPPQNYDGAINKNVTHTIGNLSTSNTYYADFVLAHTHFIDGTAYAASDFGSTDATTGIWKPKTSPSVTYGTNGWFLKYENSGSMGTDSSGNANNFSVSAGTLTQTVDTPSNVFATFNPLRYTGNLVSFAEGNLKITALTDANTFFHTAYSSLGVTKGKWYAEFKCVVGGNPGNTIMIAGGSYEYDQNANNQNGIVSGITHYNGLGEFYVDTVSSSGLTTYTSGDIIGVALNVDDGQITFYKNGSQISTTRTLTTTASNGITYFIGIVRDLTVKSSWEANFGNGYFGTTAVSSAESDGNGLGLFEYAPPTGYYALCTKNINSQEYS